MIELLPGTGSGDPPPPTPPAGAEGERFPRDEDEYLNTSEDIEAGKKVMSLHKELGAAEGEGEGEYFFCQGEYDGNEKCGAICSICSGHPLLSQLAAAQTRIAALEAELSRQISLKDHCLITMDDMKKGTRKGRIPTLRRQRPHPFIGGRFRTRPLSLRPIPFISMTR